MATPKKKVVKVEQAKPTKVIVAHAHPHELASFLEFLTGTRDSNTALGSSPLGREIRGVSGADSLMTAPTPPPPSAKDPDKVGLADIISTAQTRAHRIADELESFARHIEYGTPMSADQALGNAVSGEAPSAGPTKDASMDIITQLERIDYNLARVMDYVLGK